MSNPILELPSLRSIIQTYQLSAKKKFGQNYLLDLNLTRKIARLATPLDTVPIVEVGPGPGGLSRALLLEGAKTLLLIEKDERFIQALQPLTTIAPFNISILHEDALKVSLGAAVEELFNVKQFKIVANLPYNIATPLFIRWIKATSSIIQMTLMFQKEVAQRLVALPHTKAYSRLSVLTATYGTCEIVFTLSPKAFTPPPKVSSSVIQFTPHKDVPCSKICNAVEKITAATFGQRRKMLRSSLKTLIPTPLTLLEKANIEPTLRAENVTVFQYHQLAESFLTF